MKVRELIAELKELDQEREIVIAKDAEGNSYSPLSSFWTGMYRADSTWSGEAGLEALDAEHRKHGFSEEDVITDGVPAVILCPIN